MGVFKVQSQKDYPLAINFYEFIQYDKNKIVFPGDSAEFEKLFTKLDTLMLMGEGKITIVHIGASHVQSDVYPNRFRQRLQTFHPGMNGGRGFVFPYRMAQTNNPSSYRASWKGTWETCRNVELKKNCNLGVSGITAITNDPASEINIQLREDPQINYRFDQVKIFHSFGPKSFIPEIDSSLVYKKEYNPEKGYSIFYLKNESGELNFKLERTDSAQQYFELYGISLENDDPGFIYHSLGINGASFNSYLRCNLLEQHLLALNPDLIIISLGTNDAYTTRFSPQVYKSNYEHMIAKIRKVLPGVAILNTVANDSYLFRRYPNKNTQLAAEVIYQVAKKNNCGVWDFYEVMGGFNSSKLWLRENLMGRDLVHFNQEGYTLKGDLLFNAFLKSYDYYLNSRQNK